MSRLDSNQRRRRLTFVEHGLDQAFLLHDLGVPLATVSLYAQMLDGLQRSTDTKRLLMAVTQLETYIAHARQQLKGQSKKRKFSLYPALMVAVESLKERAQTSQVPLIVPPKFSYYCQGQRTVFIRLLINLLLNAIEACEQQGHGSVWLTLGVNEGRVVITIKDSGGGLAQLPSLLNSSKPQGLGLGLYSARLMAAQLGGGIRLINRPGRGVTIKLWLPMS